jgi:hypothetical protein
MTVKVADMHVHVQRLVSIVKMATVHEEYVNKEQLSVVHFFCGQKDAMQRIFIKKYFLFVLGSVYHVKRSTLVAYVSLMMTERLKWRCGSD